MPCCWAVRLNGTVHCHKTFYLVISNDCQMTDLMSCRRHYTVRNILLKCAPSARDFCNLYPIENAQTEFPQNWLANVSSSARSLMTVHRSIQTHGPITASVAAGRSPARRS